jgi:predicted negative regulator of RcsB-dependent stress response
MMQIEMLRGYMDVVDRYTRLARDPVASAIAAIVTAKDIHKQRGNDAAIAFLTKALSEAKNDAVQRAIRFQLVEVYREAGQQDKAVEMLSALINVPADK